jgi:hypothetical protein
MCKEVYRLPLDVQMLVDRAVRALVEDVCERDYALVQAAAARIERIGTPLALDLAFMVRDYIRVEA